MKGRLYKSRTDKMILGVCGGLAKYFDIDVSIVRIVWAATVLFYGTGFLFYLIAAFVLPYEDEVRENGEVYESNAYSESSPSDQQKVLAAIFIIAGMLLLLRNFRFTFYGHLIWPAALILLGVFLIFRGRNDGNEK